VVVGGAPPAPAPQFGRENTPVYNLVWCASLEPNALRREPTCGELLTPGYGCESS
jgi:hypothetical protein